MSDEESKYDEACGPAPSSSEPTALASTAEMPATSQSAVASPTGAAPKRLSVYSHIEGLQDMGQLRGLRSDRRRTRFRPNRKDTMTLKYVKSLWATEPAYLQESLRLQQAQAVVAAAIEDFALSVERIVARLEVLRGEDHPASFCRDGGDAPRAPLPRAVGGRGSTAVPKALRPDKLGRPERATLTERPDPTDRLEIVEASEDEVVARSLRRRLEDALNLEREAYAGLRALVECRPSTLIDSDSD